MVWAVSIDAADKLREMRDKLGVTFVNLMDPGSETIKRYGILNEKQGEIPHPTAIVIDKKRIIRYVRADEDYKRRPSNQELLQVLQRIEGKDQAAPEGTPSRGPAQTSGGRRRSIGNQW